MPIQGNPATITLQANELQSSNTMFNLADHADTIQVDDPPVVYSSFRPVPLTPTSYKNSPSTPIQALAPPDDNIEAICAEIPKKLQLGNPIWHSQEESPEDFWSKDLEVEETPCHKYMDEEGVIPGPPWSPLSPVFPKPSASVAENFITPQLVETHHVIPTYSLITENFLNAWLGTNVVVEAEWTIEPSKVLFLNMKHGISKS